MSVFPKDVQDHWAWLYVGLYAFGSFPVFSFTAAFLTPPNQYDSEEDPHTQTPSATKTEGP